MIESVTYNATNIAADDRVYDVRLRWFLVRNFNVVAGSANDVELYFSASPNGNYVYEVQGALVSTNLADPFTGQPPSLRTGVWVNSGSAVYKPNVFSNVQGISGADDSAAPAKNLRGEYEFVGGTGAAKTITLPTAELDSNYRILVTPERFTGTPAAGSNRVLSVTKTASNFTLTLEADPGGGNSIFFNWLLVR